MVTLMVRPICWDKTRVYLQGFEKDFNGKSSKEKNYIESGNRYITKVKILFTVASYDITYFRLLYDKNFGSL